MRARRDRVCAGVAIVLVLSGCVRAGGAGGGDPAAATPAGEDLLDTSTGAVRGVVVDTATLPLAGTHVALLPGSYATLTAEDGSFSIGRVEPGDYKLFASRLGYESGGKAITVVAGEVVTHTFVLEEIPIREPRLEVIGPFQGFMTCRMGTPVSSGFCGFPVVPNSVSEQIWSNDKLYLLYRLTSEDWQNLALEARWQPSTFATNPNMMLVLSYTNRTSTHWFTDSGAQPSPINLVYVRGEQGPGGQLPSGQPKEPDTNLTLRQWLTTPFGTTQRPVEIAFQLRCEMMASIFYSDSAPPGYTAFPDA